MRSAICGLLLLSIAAVPAVAGPGEGQAFCGEAFESLDALEATIKAKPGIRVLPSDASVVSYSDPITNFIRNFATKANEAYPAVACRRLVQVDGAFRVVTEISCGAEKEACDRLHAAYEDLDRRMRESLDKRQLR